MEKSKSRNNYIYTFIILYHTNSFNLVLIVFFNIWILVKFWKKNRWKHFDKLWLVFVYIQLEINISAFKSEWNYMQCLSVKHSIVVAE